MRVVRILLPAAAVTWALLLVAAPWLGSAGAGPMPGFVSATAYLIGATVCHQLPERTFHVDGAQLPVCARCAGLYLSTAAGVLLGGCYLLAAGLRAQGARQTYGQGSGGSSWRRWLVAAAVPTFATLLVESLGFGRPSNVTRAVAAIPLGFLVGVVLTVGLSFRGRL